MNSLLLLHHHALLPNPNPNRYTFQKLEFPSLQAHSLVCGDPNVISPRRTIITTSASSSGSITAMVHHEFSLNLESVRGLELPTALFKAVADEDVEALSDALESQGALLRLHTLNHQGNNVLHYGIINGKLETLEHLIITLKEAEEPGFKKVLEQANAQGYSPIHLACMHATNGAAQILLKHKIYDNLGARTPTAGLTPLMWAIEQGSAELALLLVQAGAQLGGPKKDVHTPRGHSVATLALERGRLGLLRALLWAGEERWAEQLLFQVDREGRTAAEWAVLHDWPEALEMFLEARRANGTHFINIREQIEQYNTDPDEAKKHILVMAINNSPICLRVILDKVNGPLEEGPLRDAAVEKLGWMYVTTRHAMHRWSNILACGTCCSTAGQIDLDFSRPLILEGPGRQTPGHPMTAPVDAPFM